MRSSTWATHSAAPTRSPSSPPSTPNWSAAAWDNNENSLWIRDAAIGAAYEAYFTRQFGVATVPPLVRDR